MSDKKVKVQLLHPRVLCEKAEPGKAGKPGKHYPKGVHEISEAEFQHPFTQAEIKAGHIVLPMSEEAKAAQAKLASGEVVPAADLKAALARLKTLEAELVSVKSELDAANALLAEHGDDEKEESGKGKKKSA